MVMIDLMVVDDEEGVRRSLKKVLEREGYRIILAGNGQEAIGIVREDEGSIETVISDSTVWKRSWKSAGSIRRSPGSC